MNFAVVHDKKNGLSLQSIEVEDFYMGYAKRVDSNQAIIIEALRNAGAYVWIIGLPVDLLVGCNGRTMLMEIKRDSKAKKTDLQNDFFENWKGGTLARIDSVEAALRALNVLRTDK